VHGAEQYQRDGKRDVHQQPGVQPAMQPRLARELPVFFADILKIVDGVAEFGWNQKSHARERAIGLSAIG
jgi:hypothetical protein